MTQTKPQTSRSFTRQPSIILAVAFFLVAFATIFSARISDAQTVQDANGFRIGERLTYNVTIGRYANAAYAELYCVSRGRLGDKDAIELRAKFKTLELASAAYYMVDEERTTFVAPATGLPLHTSTTQNAFGLPKETVQSHLAAPTQHTDLLAMIYRLRHSGSGSLTMQEGDKVYAVTFTSGIAEKHKTDAGEYETTLVSLQSEYFTERGITDVRVNLSTDDARMPVVIRFSTAKGNVRAGLVSVQAIEPEVVAQPIPIAVRTPLPERTPKPAATPAPYVENLPLVPEVAFDLHERLEYKVSMAGQHVATMRLGARERKQFNGLDSLLLEATFSDLRGATPFSAGDFIRAHVNPETLAPRQFEMKFSGGLRAFSTIAKFDQEGSVITVGAKLIDAPVGTHSIMSLLYAARSFNLKPSRDLNNPINDTRVAVLWDVEPYIFTLRPSAVEVITVEGKQIAAQPVTVTTKNPQLDQLNIRIWLGNDESRVPVRFVIGGYQADLVSTTVVPN